MTQVLKVYHYSLCPVSRKLRVALYEKGAEFELVEEKFWQRNKEYLKINPSGRTPTLITLSNNYISGNYAIFEYLEDELASPGLIGENNITRSRVRQISEWFDYKFYEEVSKYILNEKVIKTIEKVGYPNSNAIRAAKKNLLYHLDYIAYLLKDNSYLGGESVTLADISAACQLSVLDYMDDMPWEYNQRVKSWYALIKSRPSFRQILQDEIYALSPPTHYTNPDF